MFNYHKADQLRMHFMELGASSYCDESIINYHCDPEYSEWITGLRNGRNLMYILESLTETGVFDLIEEAGSNGATAEYLATTANIDLALLVGILDYTALCGEKILVKTGNRYSPGATFLYVRNLIFRAILKSDICAYGSILQNLTQALRREVAYGVDFVRNGKALAEASLACGRYRHPSILAAISAHGHKVIADLGCGAAGVLVDFCRLDEGIQCIGVDNDPSAIIAAESYVQAEGFSERILLVEGDVLKPDTFAFNESLKNVEAFVAVSVFHEFLRHGESAVIRMFQDYIRLFPGRHLYMGEFDAKNDDEYASLLPSEKSDSIYIQHLAHPLSRQGIPVSRETWHDLFKKSGVKCIGEDHGQFGVRGYLLLL